MTFRSLLIGALAAAVLPMAAPAQTKLSVANFLPMSHPLITDVMQPFADDVARVTEGRVTVEIMTAALGAPSAQFDFAQNGVADISFGVQGYTPGRFTTTAIAEMPFLSDTAEALSVAYQRVFDAMLSKAGEYDSVKVLAVFTHGPGHIFAKGRDLTTVDGVTGSKLRVGGGVIHEIARALGVVPVEGPSTQAYEQISQGVSDGIFFPFESVEFFKLIPYLDQGLVVPGGLYNTSFFIVMNKAKWEMLSDADKQAIESIIGEPLARRAGQAWDKADASGRAAMEGKLDLIEASDEQMAAFKQKLQPIVDKQLAAIGAKGVDAAAAHQMLIDEVARESAAK